MKYTAKYKKELGELAKLPPFDGLFAELERIEKIRDSLYKACQSEPVMQDYTNKIGATNAVINAAVKEYKLYSKQYADLCKTIESLKKDRAAKAEDDTDEFLKLFGGEINGKK